MNTTETPKIDIDNSGIVIPADKLDRTIITDVIDTETNTPGKQYVIPESQYLIIITQYEDGRVFVSRK